MGKALLWSREKGRRGGGRALLDGLGKMELIAVGVEPAGRWRAAALLPLEGHWIITLGVGEERQADRETEMKCLRLYFSSGLENHLFQSILLLWESTGLSDGGLEPERFPFLRPHLQSFMLQLTINAIISLHRKREWTWDCLSSLLLHPLQPYCYGRITTQHSW